MRFLTFRFHCKIKDLKVLVAKHHNASSVPVVNFNYQTCQFSRRDLRDLSTVKRHSCIPGKRFWTNSTKNLQSDTSKSNVIFGSPAHK